MSVSICKFVKEQCKHSQPIRQRRRHSVCDCKCLFRGHCNVATAISAVAAATVDFASPPLA
eukprot:6194222-Pleurochrysis_carterae.AAC.1